MVSFDVCWAPYGNMCDFTSWLQDRKAYISPPPVSVSLSLSLFLSHTYSLTHTHMHKCTRARLQKAVAQDFQKWQWFWEQEAACVELETGESLWKWHLQGPEIRKFQCASDDLEFSFTLGLRVIFGENNSSPRRGAWGVSPAADCQTPEGRVLRSRELFPGHTSLASICSYIPGWA